ncbi:MAG: hypothetical protein ACO1RT_19940, partial [Planctomycetaceae bacterium]
MPIVPAFGFIGVAVVGAGCIIAFVTVVLEIADLLDRAGKMCRSGHLNPPRQRGTSADPNP